MTCNGLYKHARSFTDGLKKNHFSFSLCRRHQHGIVEIVGQKRYFFRTAMLVSSEKRQRKLILFLNSQNILVIHMRSFADSFEIISCFFFALQTSSTWHCRNFGPKNDIASELLCLCHWQSDNEKRFSF